MVEREHLFGRRVQSNPYASKEELNTACSLASHTQPSAYLGLGVRSQTTCSVSLFSNVYILTVGLRGVGLSEVDCT